MAKVSFSSLKLKVKEDIEEIESIRQKYHIPLASHLSILANIHEGTQSYIHYLEKFGIASVSLFFNNNHHSPAR